jgi:hypothetical protein
MALETPPMLRKAKLMMNTKMDAKKLILDERHKARYFSRCYVYDDKLTLEVKH